MKVCAVEGCERRVAARGYCHTHYKRWRTGAPLTSAKTCRREGCGNLIPESARSDKEYCSHACQKNAKWHEDKAAGITRTACIRCGGPKDGGQGRRYCETCINAATWACKTCGETKPIASFNRSSTGTLIAKCKDCRRTHDRARWQEEGPVRLEREKERYQRRKAENPEALAATRRAQSLRAKFGITLEQFDLLREAQGDACAMCSEQFKETPQVDHDHACCPSLKTCGKCIRGLLCRRCNGALGFYEKYGDLAAAYLNRRNLHAVA
jgi:hypothetical protein